MRRRRSAIAAVALAGALPAARAPLAAQAAATLDVGAARVEYDGFLPSVAATLSPAFRLAAPATTVTARGTLARFESGRHTLHGFVAASHFLPPRGAVRAELSGTLGSSRYADFARFTHAVAGVRIHRIARSGGGWLGVAGGSTTYGAGWRPVASWGAGAWTTWHALEAGLSANATTVGDTSYTDLEGLARLARGRLSLDGTLGARVWSRGGGGGVYGEATATLGLTARAALVTSGGRYPSDPTRGTVPGRYLSLALRLSLTGAPRAGSTVAPAPAPGSEPPLAGHPLEIGRAHSDLRAVRVLASGALHVEVRGDFTDWEPVPLAHRGGGWWEALLPVTPGLRRVQLRVNGGEWRPPAGTTVAADEFGSLVGWVVVRQ